MALRRCFREPIPEIALAAQWLDAAVTAHAAADYATAEKLICKADMPILQEFTESVWGRNSPYVKYSPVLSSPAALPKQVMRMPDKAVKKALLARDGHHCRFCGTPVVRAEVRRRIQSVFPSALRWASGNAAQHAAFQLMWAQYDHIVPHAKGGSNALENMVITCAPCNFGRMNYTLEEVGLVHPFDYPPLQSTWDGLERFNA